MTTSPVPPVPSDTDRPADPADAAVAIVVELLDRVVSGHLGSALEVVENGDGAFEDYSPHPVSIEGDAHAIVEAVTPILTASIQGRLDTAEGRMAKSDELGARLREFLADQFRIARDIEKTEDKGEQQRLLGLAEARATLRAMLDGCDDFMVSRVRACTGCGKCDYCANPARALGLGEEADNA